VAEELFRISERRNVRVALRRALTARRRSASTCAAL